MKTKLGKNFIQLLHVKYYSDRNSSLCSYSIMIREHLPAVRAKYALFMGLYIYVSTDSRGRWE